MFRADSSWAHWGICWLDLRSLLPHDNFHFGRNKKINCMTWSRIANSAQPLNMLLARGERRWLGRIFMKESWVTWRTVPTLITVVPAAKANLKNAMRPSASQSRRCASWLNMFCRLTCGTFTKMDKLVTNRFYGDFPRYGRVVARELDSLKTTNLDNLKRIIGILQILLTYPSCKMTTGRHDMRGN